MQTPPPVLTTPPVTPFYQQSLPNETLHHGNFNVRIQHDDSTDEWAECTLETKFGQSTSLQATVELNSFDSFFSVNTGKSVKLFFPNTSQPVEALIIKRSPTATVFAVSRIPIRIGRDCEISESRFHLINWPEFFGKGNYVLQKSENSWQAFGRLSFSLDDWDIDISPLENFKALIEQVEESGGSAITHAGSITKRGGNLFSADELQQLIDDINNIFSFILGRWSHTCLHVGMLPNGEKARELLGVPTSNSDRFDGSRSVFDIHHPELFIDLAVQLFSLIKHPDWRKEFYKIAYFYVNSNSAGRGLNVDLALIPAQSCLELLSWIYCISDRKLLSQRAFESRGGLNAYERIKLLLRSLDIPLNIPESCDSLLSSPGKKWEDGPAAIVELRNRIVHPTETRKTPSRTYYDAWKLAMWYIEMVVLRRSGYSGKYANRLRQHWIGEVDDVPWAK